jgi:P-type Na+/K+ transporter
MFKKKGSGVELNRRTDTTISVTVPAQNPDFFDVTPKAHTLSVSRLARDLGTSITDGLSKNEAARRLQTYGENLLKGDGGVSAWKVLIGQLGMSFLISE